MAALTRPTWVAAGVIALALAAYWPGLHGPFLFDDFSNIVLPLEGQATLDWQRLWEFTISGFSGPLGRPLSMATFALNAKLGGVDPFWFKFTNLALHLLNGFLVFTVTERLARLPARNRVAEPRLKVFCLLVAFAWLMHPLQLNVVLYTVQRMTSLSSTFVLLGVLTFLNARRLQQAGERRRALGLLWLGFPLCLLLAALAKESGLLLVGYVFVIEATLFRFRSSNQMPDRDMQWFFGLMLGLPLAAAVMLVAVNPAMLFAGEAVRGFTVFERLLTESRALCFYLRLLFFPGIGDLGIFHDDFALSTGLLSPPSTAASIVALLALVGVAWRYLQRNPLVAFGIGWFLVGHAMESTVILLEPVQLHRNYLPFFGGLVAAAACLDGLSGRKEARLLGVGVLVWLAMVVATTALRARQWGDEFSMSSFEVIHHPNSPRANYEMGRILANAARTAGAHVLQEESLRFLQTAAELNPRDISALVGIAIIKGHGWAPAEFASLRERLAARPLAPTDIPFLRSIVDCRVRTGCDFPQEQVLELFNLAASRAGADNEARADVLSILALYSAQSLGDVSRCVELMSEAAHLQPKDARAWLNLAEAQLLLPDYEGAAESLRKAEELDPWRMQRSRWERLRADLDKFRHHPDSATGAATP